MIRASGGKKRLKRQTLEFGVKYSAWMKPGETYMHTFGNANPQLGSERLSPLGGKSCMSLLWLSDQGNENENMAPPRYG